MSAADMARRTEVHLTFEGADITQDVNKYFQGLTFTDNETGKTDDLQLTIDDREFIWLGSWLNRKGGTSGKMTGSGDGKGAELTAVIVQKNWNSDGKDAVLDCGTFEVDSVSTSGPPAKVTIKGVSIPFTSTARTEKKTKAWENYKLSGMAQEIAGANGMACMFLSSYDPTYARKEQVSESDIVFLERLCRNAGISIKATAKTVVLFDAAEYEQKPEVRTIERRKTGYTQYSFSTSLHDKAYTKCTVTYTDPKKKKTYKGEYTAPDAKDNGSGQTLTIKDEAVYSNSEAKTLAKKRLREKNCQEFKASFTLPGDVGLVAGVTVRVKGWGTFDGKYIVETATHAVDSSGYKTSISCRRVLEGY